MILRYWWVILVSLGFLPTLLLTNVLLESATVADWSCTRVEFGAPGSQYGGCSIIAGELIVAVAVSWIAPLSLLVVLLYLTRRARQRGGGRVDQSDTLEYETGTDRVAIFVRLAAVLVGLGNVLAVDPRDVFASSEGRSLAALSGALLLAVAAGFVASEVVLRLGRAVLSGGFFARYAITVLGVCLGGAVLGGSSVALGVLTNSPGAQSPGWSVAILAYAALAYGLIAALVGGVMGALEGLILGLPLAAILGVFRQPPNQERDGSLPGVAVSLCLMVIAAVVSYAAAPTPEAETADLNDNPPLSCPEYLGEEIATFRSPGNQTTPTFERRGTDGDTRSPRQASALSALRC